MGNGNNAGFTLLELVVVIAIVGIAGTMAIMSFDFGGSNNVRVEAKRLVSLVRLAIDESIIQGSDMGLEFTPDGYRFLRFEYDDQGIRNWRVLETESVLRPRTLPEIVVLTPIDPDSGAGVQIPTLEDNDASQPQIVFLSSGEITPFQLSASNGGGEGKEYRIVGEWDGSIVLKTHGMEN
uniref:Type II secretion system protein H n=1 Tax=Candidatus Kentrum sp. FW TaxID=2126338 RepID=A0A450SM69_9GAMM|nr:MAG: general secretion pathway protein H [Candidatus Kentron sp. FW]